MPPPEPAPHRRVRRVLALLVWATCAVLYLGIQPPPPPHLQGSTASPLAPLPPPFDDASWAPWLSPEASPDPSHCLGAGLSFERFSPTSGVRYVSPNCGGAGGIGNQLFCLSAAVQYARLHNRCVVAPWLRRHFSSNSSGVAPYNTTVFRHFRLEEGIVPHISNDALAINQPSFLMEYGVLPASDQWLAILMGGYTHYKYAWSERDYLRAYLRPAPTAAAALRERYPELASGGIAVHFRRGDFLGDANFPLPNRTYYEQAMELFSRQQPPSPEDVPPLTIYICTNDLPWAREQAWIVTWPGRVIFVEEDEVATFYVLMLAGRGVICANSTYCWWAAFLGVMGRPIYMPVRWYESPWIHVSGVFFPGVTVVASTPFRNGELGPPAKRALR